MLLLDKHYVTTICGNAALVVFYCELLKKEILVIEKRLHCIQDFTYDPLFVVTILGGGGAQIKAALIWYISGVTKK